MSWPLNYNHLHNISVSIEGSLISGLMIKSSSRLHAFSSTITVQNQEGDKYRGKIGCGAKMEVSKPIIDPNETVATSWCCSQLPEDKISCQLSRVKHLVPQMKIRLETVLDQIKRRQAGRQPASRDMMMFDDHSWAVTVSCPELMGIDLRTTTITKNLQLMSRSMVPATTTSTHMQT